MDWKMKECEEEKIIPGTEQKYVLPRSCLNIISQCFQATLRYTVIS